MEGFHAKEPVKLVPKSQRVYTRNMMRLSESGGEPDKYTKRGAKKALYSVHYRDRTGGEVEFGENPPISVYVMDYRTLQRIPELAGKNHELALQKCRAIDGHKIALIHQFFWESEDREKQFLPPQMRGRGFGSGAFDLLLKELHAKGVDFVTLFALPYTMRIVKERGFKPVETSDTHCLRIHVLTKEGLAEQIKRIEKEDRAWRG